MEGSLFPAAIARQSPLYAVGRWYFTPSFAAGLEAELGDNVTTYGIGVRWSFAPGSAGRSFSSNR